MAGLWMLLSFCALAYVGVRVMFAEGRYRRDRRR